MTNYEYGEGYLPEIWYQYFKKKLSGEDTRKEVAAAIRII